MTEETPDDDKTPGRNRPGSVIAIAALLALGIGLLMVGKGSQSDRDADGSGAGRAGVASALAGDDSFSPEQTRTIEKIVKDYLLKNPELIVEIQQALDAKMEKEQSEKTKALVASNAKEIYRNPNAAVAGNPNGDITVVEFFDYNCGYCKRGFPQVAKLIEQDKNVRVVFKELPIIRDESEPVSRLALAANLQGRYWEVHQALIKFKGLVNEAEALKIAEKLGLDMEKLKADMSSPAVKEELERTKALAQKMGINGTPHFLVGDQAIGGAPENLQEILEKHVTELRQSGCNYC